VTLADSNSPYGIPTGAQLSQWPGAERRRPQPGDRDYLILSSLVKLLRREMSIHLSGRQDLRVLDLGCGTKPYLPLFTELAASYRGLDQAPGPGVDDVGVLEALPYDSQSADVVLCTQVLEHVPDPAASVSEMHRVLVPGGLALVSTHGVFPYHPDPPTSDQDYWRWTHAGLRRLFGQAGDWSHLAVMSNGEALVCLTAMACMFLAAAGARLGSGARLSRLLISVLNRLAERADPMFPARARAGRPGSLSANYLVSAIRA
jgi:SAM-dependent methyltransferase